MPIRHAARHRAPARPLTPLTTAAGALRRRSSALARGTAVVAAASGLVVSLTASAGATSGTAAAPAEVLAAVPLAAALPVSAPVTAPAAAAVESAFAELPQAPQGPQPTVRTPDGAPAELAGYGNGRLPAEALQPIGQGAHALWGPAAEAFAAMHAAAAREGVELLVTDSYRPYEDQVALAARKGLYSAGGLAAAPGTSDHGWGLSLDLDLDAAALAWMRAHAAEHGFTENVPRESWHWTYTA